jgi:glycerophosphoryl diester phosphodiesterase
MMKMSKKILLTLLFSFAVLSFLLSCNGDAEITGDPVDREVYVWSHNDYEQDRPLYKALELGFQMIEADIHLIDGKLFVSHDHPENLDETQELEEMYLEPLSKIIEENNGVVLPESELPFYLVIDVKTEAESTFEVLSEVIEPYHQYFTRLENGEWKEGPMRLLISGNRPSLDADSHDRVAFIDGRIPDIGAGYPEELYPVISDNWNNYFSWDGTGQIPEEEWEQLTMFVNQVHAEGKIIRFWATPDKESVWEVLLEAGVDIVNVDDLEGKRNFLDEYFKP